MQAKPAVNAIFWESGKVAPQMVRKIKVEMRRNFKQAVKLFVLSRS
jgi:hypothetical protein